jgi:ABC-type Zn uptake system ZnuABC Zn-binding protein ZnuA
MYKAILASCLVLSASPLWGQEGREVAVPLVVVAEQEDYEWVTRIGGDQVEVVSLFGSVTHGEGESYERCSQRVLELRRFSLYLVQTESQSLVERMWRERLVAENPVGQVVLVRSPRSTTVDPERAKRRVISLHRALVVALPQCRDQFDSNLEAFLRECDLQRMTLAAIGKDREREGK